MSQAGPNPVLVVGPSWIGDMVMTQSLLKVLRERDDELQIDMLAPRWSLPIVARMPEVRRAIESPFEHGELALAGRRRLGVSLRAEHYARAIVLPRSFKAALVPFFARIPVRTGYRTELRGMLLNDARPYVRDRSVGTARRYVQLGVRPGEAAEVPAPSLRSDAANARRVLQHLGLEARPPVVALMPGAEYGPAKQWPAERFAALGRALASAGVTVWVLGSAGERALAEQIAAGPGVYNLCGLTTLVEAADLLSLAAVAVSNDSGLMHVAAACGPAVVGVYGSSSPDYTPPLSPRARTVWLKLPCSPCFARTCRFGHYDCLRRIETERVLALVEELLGSAP